jgi:hypothetical protein
MSHKHKMVHEKQGPFRAKVENAHKPNRKGSKKRGGKR